MIADTPRNKISRFVLFRTLYNWVYQSTKSIRSFHKLQTTYSDRKLIEYQAFKRMAFTSKAFLKTIYQKLLFLSKFEQITMYRVNI